MIRARFAPSPTGYLHIGSARTFIFNWLYVRKHHGTMVLRIDDTDADRNTEASLNSIYEGLNWLGLNWDESYRQSERLDNHRKLAHELLARGFAYGTLLPRAGFRGQIAWRGAVAVQSGDEGALERGERSARGNRPAFCHSLSGAAREAG